MKVAEQLWKDGPSLQVEGWFGIGKFVERWRAEHFDTHKKRVPAGFRVPEPSAETGLGRDDRELGLIDE